MKLRNIWLLLAIVGAVAPWYYITVYFAGNPINLFAFLARDSQRCHRALGRRLVVSSLGFGSIYSREAPMARRHWTVL